MTNAKALSARQFAVIEDLFEGEQEQTILGKHNLSRKLYNKWLADESFNDQLDWRVAWEYRRSEFILARKAREAVSDLVGLTKSKQPETARKACLDIITMRANRLVGTPATPGDNPTPPASDTPELTPETAGKILAVLAEEKSN
ncbi:MAG: hypothetical protein WBC05_00495 [Sedimentisphaerales bacterium]